MTTRPVTQPVTDYPALGRPLTGTLRRNFSDVSGPLFTCPHTTADLVALLSAPPRSELGPDELRRGNQRRYRARLRGDGDGDADAGWRAGSSRAGARSPEAAGALLLDLFRADDRPVTTVTRALRLCRSYQTSYYWPTLLLDILERGQLHPVALATPGWDGRHRTVAMAALGMPLRRSHVPYG